MPAAHPGMPGYPPRSRDTSEVQDLSRRKPAEYRTHSPHGISVYKGEKNLHINVF